MKHILVVIFAGQAQAHAGVRALRRLDVEGELALHELGVITRSPQGDVAVLESSGEGIVGSGVGIAVGGLIGLLVGPLGMAVGAVAGSLAGALRDYWVAGAGRDFVAQAQDFLQPGTVAIVADVEEDRTLAADAAMQTAGGTVFRHACADQETAVAAQDPSGVGTERGDPRQQAQAAVPGPAAG